MGQTEILEKEKDSSNSRLSLGNQSASGMGKKTPQILDSKNNKGNHSTPLTKTSSSLRRIRVGQVASPKVMSKAKTANESLSKRHSLPMKKGLETSLTRTSHVLDSKTNLKMRKGNVSPSIASTRRSKYSNLKMTSGNMSPYAMSHFSFSTACSRKCPPDSNFDLTYRMERGRLSSPFATSPLSPYSRAYGHISQKSLKMKRSSLSPMKFSPLSSYAPRDGHISD